MSDDLMDMYHRRSDHGRDGVLMDGHLCNCRELFTAHARQVLKSSGVVMLTAEQYADLTADECHCGNPVTYGYDGDPTHHRGMCEYCDPVRCDAYPGECGR